MPDFLAAPSILEYALLAAAAAGAAAGWVRTRKKPARNAALALVGLLAGVAAVDTLVETPVEEANRRLREMSAAAARRDWDAAFSHLSDGFKYDGRLGKKELRDKVAAAAGQHNASVRFKPIEPDTVEYLPDGSFKGGFVAQADSPQFPEGRYVVYVEGVFAKDPDGAYRLRSAKTFNFLRRREIEPVPGL